MELNDIKLSLSKTPEIIRKLLSDLPENYINSNEGGDSWTTYDIVGHLIHGEKTDWLDRTRIILSDENKTFIPFNRTAMFEDSKGKNLKDLLDEFEQLREQNLIELENLNITNEYLAQKGIHPVFGEVTLKQLLNTWITHDWGHIYQILRVIAKQNKEDVGPWKEYLRIVND